MSLEETAMIIQTAQGYDYYPTYYPEYYPEYYPNPIPFYPRYYYPPAIYCPYCGKKLEAHKCGE